MLEQAKRLAGDRQLYLTITHFHPEHGFGAQDAERKHECEDQTSQRIQRARSIVVLRCSIHGFRLLKSMLAKG